MAKGTRGGKGGTEKDAPAVKGELTTDHAATLYPHGDGSATEVPNVSANGTYPARPESK